MSGTEFGDGVLPVGVVTTRVFEIARIFEGGSEVGQVYAPSALASDCTLTAEVVGWRIVLRRASGEQAELELSLSEFRAVAAACTAWAAERDGWPARLPAMGGPGRPRRPERRLAPREPAPRHLSVVDANSVTERATAAVPVSDEVMRIGHVHWVEKGGALGERLGDVYGMPGDLRLQAQRFAAVLRRGGSGIRFDALDGWFVVALAELMSRAAPGYDPATARELRELMSATRREFDEVDALCADSGAAEK